MSKIAPEKFRTAEAAEYLGLARSTLTTWRYLGRGPAYVKLGAKVVYLRSDLDDWLASRKRCQTSPPEPPSTYSGEVDDGD